MNKLSKYYNFILMSFLLVLCFFVYCINMGAYPFLDSRETQFALIAKDMLNHKDWLNISLNGQQIYDYPPLFFWITNISCLIFGKISLVSVRIPTAITAVLSVLFLFFTVNHVLKKTFAVIVSLVFSLALGMIMLSRLATYDMLSAFFMMSAILSTFVLVMCKKTNKTLLWSLIFLLSALSFLTSGLLSLLILVFSIITMFIFAGKSKELFSLKNMLLGIIIFLTLTLPWLYILINKFGFSFINNYINSWNFNIKSLAWFIIGFLPWSFSFIWILGCKFKDILNSVFSYFKDNSETKLKEKWNNLKLSDKFISLNTILFFTTLIFTLFFAEKYKFLVLFLMFPASCISGYYWYEYIVKKKHSKSIFFATLIPNIVLIICSLVGLFGHNVLNKWILQGFNHLIVPLIIIFFIIPIIGIFAVMLKSRKIAFVSNIIMMISLSFLLTPNVFNFISLKTGENDLIKYAQMAQKDKVIISAFLEKSKYSLPYYYDNNVMFYNNKDLDKLKTYLKENPQNYVIVAIKDLWDVEAKNIKYMLLDAGKKYCLIQHLSYEMEKLEDKTEPEVIVY